MKTIQIVTPQNVLIEHELASVVLRALAFLVDQIIITLFLVFAFIFLQSFSFSEGLDELFLYIAVIPIYFLYSLLFESFNYGQTLGKLLIGLKVRRLDGNEVTFTEAVTRWLMRVPDIFISAGALAAILIGSTERSQRLGDILAGTIVIRQVATAGITLEMLLKLSSTENYTPRYPQVLNLKETDVVLIKQAIIRYGKYNNEAHVKAIDALVLRLKLVLGIENDNQSKIDFLKTIIKDYIVLTR